MLNNGYIADDVPIDLVMNGTVLSLQIKAVGCWNIIQKEQLKLYVCNDNIDAFINYTIIFQIKMASDDYSYTDNVAMKWDTSGNCSSQDSRITFYNTDYEFETIVGRML